MASSDHAWSKRPLCCTLRKVRIACPPVCRQRMPEPFIRCVTSVLQAASTTPEPELSPTLQAAFRAVGQKLPELWATDVLSQPQRKALLRCLIDKVVIQRARRDQIHTRIVWRGGETTTRISP